MVCAVCGMHSFAWLAEVFVCPVCDSCDLVFPVFLGNGQAGSEGGEKGADCALIAGEGGTHPERESKKRKRSLGDERTSWRHFSPVRSLKRGCCTCLAIFYVMSTNCLL